MPSIGNRQVVVAVLLAATMVLAGCSGGGTTTPTDAADGDTTDAETEGEGGETDDGEGEVGATVDGEGEIEATVDGESEVEAEVPSLDYQWQEGESYTYEGSSSQYTWEVTDVSDGEVTAEVTTSFAGRTQTSTVTGPQGNVLQNKGMDSDAGIFTALQAFRRVTVDETLETGESWTVSGSDYGIGDGQQQVDVSVTGTSTVQGVQCYDLEMTFGNQTYSACTNEDWPFVLSGTFVLRTTTTQGGEVQSQSSRTVTYTLVESNRP